MHKTENNQVAAPRELAAVATSDTRHPARRIKALTRKNADAFQTRAYLENLPELSEVTFKSLKEMVRAHNPIALKIAAEVLKLTRGDRVNVSLNQSTNIMQANMGDGRKSFAQLVRRLEDRDRVTPATTTLDAQPEDDAAA